MESGARGGEVESGEVDVSGEVLFAGGGIEIFGGLVAEVGEGGTAHVSLIVEFASFAAVIDGDDETAL